ncbi:DUF3800 domain-containing protein [Actinoplanes regularis]|uniref:DUF3800 domain-containing protein n=1 Tax=Actinoplanes regularis TaxID=52697 RepID=A0A238XJ13_9ACTN|nr:DUF3800 domain-containing protein [Actinoplanes regularis]GIE90516.1 hypothetical protein Are01nite_69960 [Actinoplanes regularis]SNR58986.1 Protein of unknown function [Actinoplanes regularis]
MSTSTNFALFYIDDSGSEAHGVTTFSWIRIDPARWGAATQRWLKFRAGIYRRHGIAADTRLHATDLAGGRGDWARAPLGCSPQLGLGVIEDGLKVIAGLPGITLGSVYRRTGARGRGFERDKQDLYQSMIGRLDTELQHAAAYGAVVMDGDGTNTGYRRGHRTLENGSRALIEDPFFRHASTSQWVQIADLAAWTAYRALRPGGRRDKTTTWYNRILRAVDANGEPTEL